MGQISIGSIVGRVIPFAAVFGEGVLRNLERKVGDGEWNVEKEWSLLIITNEAKRLGLNQVVRILTAGQSTVVPLEGDLLLISPEVDRIEVVSLALAIVSVEEIKSLAIRIPLTSDVSEAPFAKSAGSVAARPEQLGDSHRRVWNRPLSLRCNLPVVTDICVAAVEPRHQNIS